MRAATMKPNLQALRKWAVQTARLCCGVPDYDVYVKHLREHHPERPVPRYKEFLLLSPCVFSEGHASMGRGLFCFHTRRDR